MFVVKPEAPSLPQGWQLLSDCAAPLTIFSPTSLPLRPRLCCDGVCLLEQHTHLGAATEDQQLKRRDPVRKVDWTGLSL